MKESFQDTRHYAVKDSNPWGWETIPVTYCLKKVSRLTHKEKETKRGWRSS